ncbi:hypothetical protein KVT40_008876 [Elsinoe batatas]|uniref:Uncharacterized protein n=1 Tax=Elsinoe batatas TaxID=2601811 RepID=A0A8K0KV78_9PEZI|nr:hypothetical protein KVT40_008876 [Elsinoe batatas]
MLVECPAFVTYENAALTGSTRRSIAGVYAPSPPSLDGTDDAPSSTSGVRSQSAGAAEQPTRTEQALAAPPEPARARGRTSVADRVKAINDPTKGKAIASPTRRDGVTMADGSKPHRTSTNLSKRMSPFVRRNGDAVLRDEPGPATQSQPPLKPTTIHTPVPQRHASLLFRSPDTPRPSEVSRSEREPSRNRSDFIRRHPATPKTEPNASLERSPAAYHSCARHGRRLGIKKNRGPTLEGMERSRSGAYIPSGYKIRHQIPTTSPYYYVERALTKTEGTSISPEPCPDCIAEETIRRREDAERQPSPVISPPSPNDSPGNADISSIATEPGTPVEEALSGPSLIGTSTDHQAVLLPGSAVPNIIEADMSSVVSADLGDMIDAIIIEHRGTLNRVITNLRNGAPTMDSFQQISKDLARVSTSMGTMKPERADVLDAERGRYSIILDTPPEFLTSRTKSVPDLIDYIDSAAKDLGVSLPRKEDAKQVAQCEVAAFTPKLDPLEGSPYETARPLDQAAKTLRDRAANKSLAPPQPTPEPQLASAYATANPTPSGSPTDPALTVRPNSPLILAVNIPAAMPKSTPVPMIGPSGTMNMDFTSPSEMQGNLSVVSQPGGNGPGSRPAPSSNLHSSAAPPGSAAEGMRTDGSWDARLAASKIPLPSPSNSTSSTPRRHSVQPAGLQNREVPWSALSRGGRKIPFEVLKPSDGKDVRRKSGTFSQPFVRELARDASLRERNQRRFRVGKEAVRA